MLTYAQAQICSKGHVITTDISEERGTPRCSYCGSPTISSCPDCGTPIRGTIRSDEIIFFDATYSRPSYCHNCGNPYPWTSALIESFNGIIDLADELDVSDKKILKNTFPNLLVDIPETSFSALQIKKHLKAAGKDTLNALRSTVAEKCVQTLLNELMGW